LSLGSSFQKQIKIVFQGIEVGDYPELSNNANMKMTTPMGKEEKKSKSVEEFSE